MKARKGSDDGGWYGCLTIFAMGWLCAMVFFGHC